MDLYRPREKLKKELEREKETGIVIILKNKQKKKETEENIFDITTAFFRIFENVGGKKRSKGKNLDLEKCHSKRNSPGRRGSATFLSYYLYFIKTKNCTKKITVVRL